MSKKFEFKVCGLSAKYFIPFLIIVLICMYCNFMPTVKFGDYKAVNLVGTMGFLMAIGGFFYWLGGAIPILSTHLGGAVCMCMFVPAILNYFGFIPQETVRGVHILMKYGLQDLYIATLLCGSILYMDRKVLLAAIPRYLPAIIASQVFALGFCLLAGWITGFGALDAMFNIGAPTMSGGSGGAIITIPTLYSDLSGKDWMGMSGMFVGYVTISNVVAIFMAAMSKPILNKLHMVSPEESPTLLQHGVINTDAEEKLPEVEADPVKVCGGIFICVGIYLLGYILGHLPGTNLIAGLAWSIIIAVIIKCCGLMENKIANWTVNGMNFMLKGLFPVIITGIGLNSMDIQKMVDYFSPASLVVIVVTVFGAYLGAIIFGHLSGLFGYEAGITAGLCCCNFGGSGDLAVLSAGNRMTLLAFASISTRIGGALMVIWIGILFRIFML